MIYYKFKLKHYNILTKPSNSKSDRFCLFIKPESATITKSTKLNRLTKSSTTGSIVRPSYCEPLKIE